MITDERLEELLEGWKHQARVYKTACGSMGGDGEYANTCDDTGEALRELQEFRQIQRALREVHDPAIAPNWTAEHKVI